MTHTFTAGFSDSNQTMRQDLRQMFINTFILKRNNSRSTLSVPYSQVNPQPTYRVIFGCRKSLPWKILETEVAPGPKFCLCLCPAESQYHPISHTDAKEIPWLSPGHFREEWWVWGSDCQLGRALTNQDSGVSGMELTFSKQPWAGIGHGCAWQHREPVNIPKTPFRVI